MTKKTEELIEQSYKEAVAKSTNFFSIFNNLYLILKDKDKEVANEDKENFKKFIENLKFNYGIIDTEEEKEKYATT